MKKIVHYDQLIFCVKGQSAILHPVDHPGPYVSNTKLVATSTVVRINSKTGEIETMNTIYRPVKEEKDKSRTEYNQVTA